MPKQTKDNAQDSQVEQKRKQEADFLAQSFYEKLRNQKKSVLPGLKRTIPKEQFKADKLISLTVQPDQTVDICFKGHHSTFAFAANSAEQLAPVKAMLKDFEQSFQEQYPGEIPVYELKAYSQASLDRTLNALLEVGIKVSVIKLVVNGQEKVIEDAKQIDEYYRELKGLKNSEDQSSVLSSSVGDGKKKSSLSASM